MRAIEAVAGIDLGTTSTKVLLRDVTGRQLTLLEARTPWTGTPGGGTQTSAGALADAVVRLMAAALERAEAAFGPVRVLGVGVAGLAESGVLLDRAGLPCTPVIAWFDRRGGDEADQIAARTPGFGREFVRRTGLTWDAQVSVAKLLWFAGQGVPITAGYQWLNIPEYLVHLLGGRRVSEPSLASRTGLLDQGTGRAWADGARELGLPAELLPEQLAAGTSAGRLRHPLLPPGFQGAALTVAGHDHPVAAVGAGVTGSDELFNSTGTADVIARALPGRLTGDQRERLVGQGISVGSHVLPETSLLLGGVRGGLLMRRVLTLLGAVDGEARDRLDTAALAVGGLPPGLEVVGGGPRGDDVHLQLRDDADPAAVWAAATRYTAAQTGVLLDTLHLVVPPHSRAVAGGGWTRMASVRRAKAAVIERLEFSDVTEPGVAGAAVVALQAAAGDRIDAVALTPEPSASHV